MSTLGEIKEYAPSWNVGRRNGFFYRTGEGLAGMADCQGYCRAEMRQKDGNNIEVI
jgi:hypothetical protein